MKNESGIKIVELGKGETLRHLMEVIDPEYIPNNYNFLDLFERVDEIEFKFSMRTHTNIKLTGNRVTTEDLDAISRECRGFNDMICPECGEKRPNDDRVRYGMKCAICAGYGEGRQ